MIEKHICSLYNYYITYITRQLFKSLIDSYHLFSYCAITTIVNPMKKLAFYLDGVRQFSSCPKAQNLKKLHECVALLAAEETRRSHLTSNWFHQTWKLHCYLVFCLSASKEESNNCYELASAFFNEDFL